MSNEERDLFPARLLLRGWPQPVVNCPQCGDTVMRAVAVRIRHGDGESIFDSDGVRKHEAAPRSCNDLKLALPAFELEVTLQCAAHELILRIAPQIGGSLRALVEVEPLERFRAPIGQTHSSRTVKGSVVTPLRAEKER